jgi:Uma2 family endonuclease
MSQILEKTQEENFTIEILPLFPRQGKWTEVDYFRLPETNQKVELVKGVLIISPAPSDKHQKISLKLSYSFYSYLLKNNVGEVRYSPLDVRLWEDNIRQPDIAFMSKEHLDRITDECWGVPDLVVEILSPSNTETDKEDKFKEYQKAGVLEYWIVDPFNQSIEIFTLENGAYKLFGKWGLGETAKSKLLDGFGISVDDVLK